MHQPLSFFIYAPPVWTPSHTGHHGEEIEFLVLRSMFSLVTYFIQVPAVHDLSNPPPLACRRGFPAGSDRKESACSAGDLGSIPGSGRSPGEGNGYPLQGSCLENSTDRGAWPAIVHEVTESDTNERLTHTHTHTHTHVRTGGFLLHLQQLKKHHCPSLRLFCHSTED